MIGQLGILVVTKVANSADPGGSSAIAGNNAYNNAFLIFVLPHSLVTVSLLTAMFTRMAGHAAADDTAAVRTDVDTGLRLIGVFTVIAGAVISVVALPMVRVLFPTASPPSAASLPPIIVALALGLPAIGVWALVQRVHDADEDAKGLFAIQVAMGGVVAVGALVGRFALPRTSWVAGAGLAIAASYTLGAVWGGISVKRRIGAMGSRGTLAVVGGSCSPARSPSRSAGRSAGGSGTCRRSASPAPSGCACSSGWSCSGSTPRCCTPWGSRS